jgi:hypothetical protein
VPDDVRLTWKAAFRNAALYAFTLSGLLTRLHAVLDGADVPYAALKGAYLARHAWPHPGLRPLRDVDILVPRERAMETWRLLLQNGFRAEHEASAPTDLDEHSKHLPLIRDEKSGIHVDIHFGLINAASVSPEVDGAAFSADALQRRQQCGGAGLFFLNPTDALLHLIIHAALDHKFDNGPLLFGDIANLVCANPPNWPAFWQNAKKLEATRAAVLVLTMAQWFEGPLNIIWHQDPAPSLPDDIVRTASLMTLVDFENRSVVGFGAHWLKGGWRQRYQLVTSYLMPTRHTLENFFAAQGKSLFEKTPPIWALYLWWSVDRAWTRFRQAFSPQAAAQARSAASVLSWIECGEPSH